MADNGMALIVPCLDMPKAFDRWPHLHLLAKIRSFGITDTLLPWINSYLSNRSQVFSINGHCSKPKPVTSGVIQGSFLGPLLFLMYINDIFLSVSHGTPFLFADDIKIVYSFKPECIASAISNISEDISALHRWCSTWQMNFSADKCEVLTYKCKLPPGSLTVCGSTIANKQIVRDLGLNYSCTFNFSEYSALQVAKARKCLGLIFRSFQLRDCILFLYKSHARPLLEYCPLIFSSMRKSDRIGIESVQRSFTKRLIGWSSALTYK